MLLHSSPLLRKADVRERRIVDKHVILIRLCTLACFAQSQATGPARVPLKLTLTLLLSLFLSLSRSPHFAFRLHEREVLCLKNRGANNGTVPVTGGQVALNK